VLLDEHHERVFVAGSQALHEQQVFGRCKQRRFGHGARA